MSNSVKKSVVGFLLILVLLITGTSQVYGGENSKKEEFVKAIVTFTTPLTVESSLDVLKESNAQPLELFHSYTFTTLTQTGGYVVNGSLDTATITQSYIATTITMYQNVGFEITKMINDLSESLNETEIDHLNNQLQDTQSIVQALYNGETQVYALRASIPSEYVETLRQNSVVASVEVENSVVTTQNNYGPEAGPWKPNRGTVAVQPTGTASRYVWQTFKWDSTRLTNLKNYSNVTYEAEAWFNNYDGRYYLGSSVEGWTSSLPNAYKDTNFANGAQERGYTIGTAKASALQANTYYTTYIQTNKGNYSSDSGKLNGQRGHRNPSWCYSTWCIWPDETASLVSAWNVPVPGWKDWSN